MSFSTDLTHFLAADGRIPEDSPARLRRMVGTLAWVINEVTTAFPAKKEGIRTGTACFARGCRGEVIGALQSVDDPVEWRCSRCNESGTITNWRGSQFDHADAKPSGLAIESLALPPRPSVAKARSCSRRSDGLPGPTSWRACPPTILQLKITLEVRPRVWRRIQVPGDITLDRLHRTLQVVMGWSDTERHQFSVDGEYYGESEFENNDDFDVVDESMVRLLDIVKDRGDRFDYDYHFRDFWQHHVVVEKLTPPEPRTAYPRCMAGGRSAPPEDVGGASGFRRVMHVLRSPDHPEHAEYAAWIGPGFDPEAFDLDAVNEALEKAG